MKTLVVQGSRWSALAAVTFAGIPVIAVNHAPHSNMSRSNAPHSNTVQMRAQEGIVRAESSPDGAWTVFATDPGTSDALELYAVPSAGGSPHRVGSYRPLPEGTPWSIDAQGTRVVFGGPDLFSAPLDGSAATLRLSEPLVHGSVRDFTLSRLSPDGARVVYRAAPADRYLGLFSAPLDGSTPPLELVAPGELGDVARSYQVSDLTRSVVFVSRHEDGVHARLHARSIDGGPLMTLSDPGLAVDDFQLSPDGANVVFRAARRPRRGLELYVVPVGGAQEPVRLSAPLARSVSVLAYALSPDGVWAVYLAEQGANGRNALLSVRLDGSSPAIELAAETDFGFQIHPDGRSVLYRAHQKAHQKDGERSGLFAAALDGSSEPCELSAPLASCSWVNWFGLSGDGARVVYQVHEDSGDSESSTSLWCTSLTDLARVELGGAAGSGAAGMEDLQIAGGERLVYRDPQARLLSLPLDGDGAPLVLESSRVAPEFRVSSDGLAKPMLVSLPILLLLFDFWPLRRKESWRRLVLEKAPLFALSLASCVATSFAQSRGGFMRSVTQYPIGGRIANAAVSYVVYLVKAIWPSKLSVYYPYPYAGIPAWEVGGAVLTLALVTAVCVRVRLRAPYLFVGWLWYLVTLVPVIGLVQVGSQAMADRYTYVPLIGPFAMLAFGLPERSRRVSSAAAAAAVFAFGLTAFRQAGYWRDSVVLFTHAVAVTKDNAVAESSLARALFDRGQIEPAVLHCAEAVRIAPEMADAQANLVRGLLALGRNEEALARTREALRLRPNDSRTHVNVGLINRMAGRDDAAVASFREAIRLDPTDQEAHLNLGALLAGRGLRDEAIAELETAVRLRPGDARARQALAAILERP